MQLTHENYRVYAARHYDNHSCISEKEFLEDLNKVSVIKRLVSRYMNGENINIRMLVNIFITYYNVFDHHCATRLIEYKVDEPQIPYINSILAYLSMPLIDGDIHTKTLLILQDNFR